MLLPTTFSPAAEAVFTIAPRDSRSAPAAAFAQRNGPIRFVVSMACQNSSERRSKSGFGIGSLVHEPPRIVDEVIKTAECLNDLLYHPLGLARQRNVTRRASDVQALLVEPVNSLARATRIVRNVVQSDGSAMSGEDFDGRQPDPRRSASNEDFFSTEVCTHFKLFGLNSGGVLWYVAEGDSRRNPGVG
jgi:hypothetical protein